MDTNKNSLNTLEDRDVIENSLYESFENRKAKKILEIITKKIKPPKNCSLNAKSQELIEEIGVNAAELQQLINDEAFNTHSEKDIFQALQSNLKKLQDELKQLPYSNQRFINSLCKAINTLLEKIADFLTNGPIVSEGVYLANPSGPSHFNFFHPSRTVNTSIEDLSERLSSFSTNPYK